MALFEERIGKDVMRAGSWDYSNRSVPVMHLNAYGSEYENSGPSPGGPRIASLETALETRTEAQEPQPWPHGQQRHRSCRTGARRSSVPSESVVARRWEMGTS